MRRLWNTFLKGLAAVLPAVLTLYVVWWLATGADEILGGWLRVVAPELYWPGLGLVVSFLLVLLVGVIVDAYIVRRLFRFGEAMLARIPIVKTIFGAVKDFARFLPAGEKRRDLKRVVMWRFGSARLIGFVTEENINPRMFAQPEPDIVAVYFPMSYQIGGYTLYLSKSELEPTQLSVEEAMRLVLIGGVTASAASPASSPGPSEAAR
jgi:uncharacterized membrane protein